MLDELILLSLLLTAVALISCWSVEDRQRIRRLPRWAWATAILLLPLVGSVAWFALGRPRRSRLRSPRWMSWGVPPMTGPDDDPRLR